MKTEQMFNLLGRVDLALVEDAASAFDAGAAAAGRRKAGKHGLFPKRWMNIAACLALIAGVIFAARCLILRFGGLPGQTIIDMTDRSGGSSLSGSHKPEAPPLPWEGCFTFRAYTSRGCFTPGVPVVIHIEAAVTGDMLTEGELRLTVDGASPDFILSCAALSADGDTIRLGHPGRRYTKESPLCFDLTLTPTWDKDDWANGKISLSLLYIPDDPQRFVEQVEGTRHMDFREGWQDALFADNVLRLASSVLYYAADRVETRVRASSSAMGLLNDMLIAHYRCMAISGREFSRIFYEDAYRGSICAAVHSVMPDTKSVRYTYQSRNIRYDGTQYIQSDGMYDLYSRISALYDAGDFDSPACRDLSRQLACLALADMRDRGVITQAEYASEAAYLAECDSVGGFEPAFPMGLDGLGHRVVQKYRDTHTEP